MMMMNFFSPCNVGLVVMLEKKTKLHLYYTYINRNRKKQQFTKRCWQYWQGRQIDVSIFSFLVCLRPTSTSLYSTQHQQRILEIVVKTKKKSRGGFNLFNNTKKMRERERDRKKSTPEYNIHENISFFPFSLSLFLSLFFLW